MTPDRETILAAAQQFADQSQYARALDEYRKLLAADPNDAKILLKVGDLQMRAADYGGAIATYDRVARAYADQGFALKAVAVYKQIRELLLTQRADLLPSFGHVLDHLVQLCVGLGLPQDALHLLDEEATRLRKANSEDAATDVYRRMTQVAPGVPLPYLRYAESLCRIGRVDEALTAFGHASQMLLSGGRHDDALRVMERMLHFRSDAPVALQAAKLYIAKGTAAEGMQALSRLQVCFQADPNSLEVLDLLAHAFDLIGQPDKATEVRKELMRLADEQGDSARYDAAVKHLAPESAVGAHNTSLGTSKLPPAPATREASRAASNSVALGTPPPKPRRPELPQPSANAIAPNTPAPSPPASVRPSVPPPPPPPPSARGSMLPPPRLSTPSPLMTEERPHSERGNDGERVSRLSREIAEVTNSSHPPLSTHGTEHDGVDSLDELELVDDETTGSAGWSVAPAAAKAGTPDQNAAPGAPLASRLPPPTSQNLDVATHTRDVLARAQSFRARGQFAATLETLQNGLALTPRSIELREAMRDVCAETGDRDAAIEEMLTMAAIYIDYGRPDHAATVLRNILEAEPSHVDAGRALAGLSRAPVRHSSAPPQNRHSPSSPPAAATLLSQSGAPLSKSASPASVEESLEEADFFASRGLYADARRILMDQLLVTPGNPLILELLTEIDERIAQGGEGQPRVEQRDSDFNLKEQLNELGRVVRESQQPPKMGLPKAPVDVESVFAKFKAGVKAQISDADSATHYDLGIAYKDMSLFNDAVEELKLAAQDVTRECNCYAMIGLIYAEQKLWEQARKYYSKGLGAVRRTPNQETALYYELGHVSENAEHLDQAAYYFRQVLRRDANFRDARDRLSKLRNSWAPPEARGSVPANQDEEVDRAFDELLNDA